MKTKRMMAIGLVVSMCAVPSGAWAQQDEGEAPVQEIVLEELEVDGRVRGSAMMRQKASESAKFERLTRLKKSALPALRGMAKGL